MPEQIPQTPPAQSNSGPFGVQDVSDDWAIGFDPESGGIQLRAYATDQPPQGDRVIDPNNVLSQPPPMAQQAEQQAPPPQVDSGDRIARLEMAVAQMVGLLQGQGQQQQAPPAQTLNGQPVGQPQYDLSDPAQLAGFITDSVQRNLNMAMNPIMQILPALASRVQMNDMQAQYSNEYAELRPFVQQMLAVDPNLPVDKAFELVKLIRSSGKPPRTDGNTRQVVPQQQAQAFVARANDLQPIQGVNPSLANQTPQVNSLRDAMNLALQQLGGGR